MTNASDSSDATLDVAEIFKSIQGESTWAGLPCVFVRLAGCDVGCSYCDTAYAQSGGETMMVKAILGRCAELGGPLCEITGGEPLQQAACPELAARLLDKGYTVLCETSGTRPIDTLPAGVIRIMDLKCPGSGACSRNHWANIDALTPRDEVKFVVTDRHDYEWSRDMVRTHRLTERCHEVLFSPVLGRIEPKAIVAWILADELPVRFQLQLHKYIWQPGERGV
jgi:7-carboxy-7-deazaguanine synthase